MTRQPPSAAELDFGEVQAQLDLTAHIASHNASLLQTHVRDAMNLIKVDSTDYPAKADLAKLHTLLEQMRDERQRIRGFKNSIDDLRQALDDATAALDVRLQELSGILLEVDKEVFELPLGEGQSSRLKKALRPLTAAQAATTEWRATARSRIRQRFRRPKNTSKSTAELDNELDALLQSAASRI